MRTPPVLAQDPCPSPPHPRPGQSQGTARGTWGAAPTLYFDASLRFDSDFGGYALDRPTGSNEIHELQQSQIDILYAVLGGRNLAGGHVDFELGRQVHFDLVDFYAFDGTDYSDWIECELTLDLPTDPGGTPDGGCCSTGRDDPYGAGVLLAGALLALGWRRRRGP